MNRRLIDPRADMHRGESIDCLLRIVEKALAIPIQGTGNTPETVEPGDVLMSALV